MNNPLSSLVQDSVWGGTGSSPLYQSNHTSGQQQQRFETVTSGKKKKKQKMVRADPSLLGEYHRDRVQAHLLDVKTMSHFFLNLFSLHLSFFNFSGFSVNASSERLNMGEIETLEDF